MHKKNIEYKLSIINKIYIFWDFSYIGTLPIGGALSRDMAHTIILILWFPIMVVTIYLWPKYE